MFFSRMNWFKGHRNVAARKGGKKDKKHPRPRPIVVEILERRLLLSAGELRSWAEAPLGALGDFAPHYAGQVADQATYKVSNTTDQVGVAEILHSESLFARQVPGGIAGVFVVIDFERKIPFGSMDVQDAHWTRTSITFAGNHHGWWVVAEATSTGTDFEELYQGATLPVAEAVASVGAATATEEVSSVDDGPFLPVDVGSSTEQSVDEHEATLHGIADSAPVPTAVSELAEIDEDEKMDLPVLGVETKKIDEVFADLGNLGEIFDLAL